MVVLYIDRCEGKGAFGECLSLFCAIVCCLFRDAAFFPRVAWRSLRIWRQGWMYEWLFGVDHLNELFGKFAPQILALTAILFTTDEILFIKSDQFVDGSALGIPSSEFTHREPNA